MTKSCTILDLRCRTTRQSVAVVYRFSQYEYKCDCGSHQTWRPPSARTARRRSTPATHIEDAYPTSGVAVSGTCTSKTRGASATSSRGTRSAWTGDRSGTGAAMASRAKTGAASASCTRTPRRLTRSATRPWRCRSILPPSTRPSRRDGCARASGATGSLTRTHDCPRFNRYRTMYQSIPYHALMTRIRYGTLYRFMVCF